MKASLRAPLRSQIQDGLDEVGVQRMWRGIRARAVSHPNHRTRKFIVSLAIGSVSILAICLIISWSASKARSGPLRFAGGGSPPPRVVNEGHTPRQLDFEDGSNVIAGPRAHLDVLANNAGTFLIALRIGAARFSVRPGGIRRWIVECGAVRVEVVGTEFEVQRDPGAVRVTVAHGVVVVQGENVPDRVQRLVAGDNLVIPTIASPLPTGAAATPTATPTPMATPAPGTAPAPPVAAATTTAPSRPSPAPIETKTLASSSETTDANGSRASLDDLVQDADEARRTGDLSLAIRLLTQVVDKANGDPAGAVAALTLARLTMQTDPAGAARVLTTALRSGVPRGLEEDARARLVEARMRSADRVGALRAAREYEQRFPEGAYIDQIRRWKAQ